MYRVGHQGDVGVEESLTLGLPVGGGGASSILALGAPVETPRNFRIRGADEGTKEFGIRGAGETTENFGI